MVLAYQTAHTGHPFKIRLLHKSAPFSYKKRCGIVLVDEEPVVLPAVTHKAVKIIVTLKPRLLINRRTIVVRRIHQLVLIFSEIDRKILYAPEITAPPVKIVIIIICRAEILVALNICRIYLSTLYHYKHIRILGKYS